MASNLDKCDGAEKKDSREKVAQGQRSCPPPAHSAPAPTHPQHERRLHEGGQQFGQRHVHVGGSLSLTSPSSTRRPVGSIPAAGSRWLSARDRTKPPREASIPPPARLLPARAACLNHYCLALPRFLKQRGLKMFKICLTFNKTGQNKKTDEATRGNSCYFCAQISSEYSRRHDT